MPSDPSETLVIAKIDEPSGWPDCDQCTVDYHIERTLGHDWQLS